MGQICIKFRMNKETVDLGDKPRGRVSRTIENFVVKALETIIPKANPDFDDKIKDVDEWWVEIDEETETPSREIGIDDKHETILIMPFRDNYGYWTDNNLKLMDFPDHFDVSVITTDEFNARWNKFEHKYRD